MSSNCGVTTKSIPLLLELLPLLTDPTRRAPIFLRQIERAFALHHVADDPPIPFGPGLQPLGKVDAECRLIGHRRHRVVLQAFLKSVVLPLPMRTAVKILLRRSE